MNSSDRWDIIGEQIMTQDTNDFRTAAKTALNDPATAIQGAMIAQHPRTGRWDYFIGGTPPHDVTDGNIVKWGKGYQSVSIPQQLAATVQSGEDDDGNEIDLELEIDMLGMGIEEGQ